MENSSLVAVVTGANGFVGSHLVDLLLSKDFKVKCITRKSSNLKWLSGKNVEIIDCGLFDKEGLKKAFKGADYIFHVAGVVKSKEPEGYFKGNVETTRTVLEAAFEAKETIKRVLIVSSQTACGPSEKGKPVNEEVVCRPITTYAKSKLEEERLAKTYMDRLPITICRAPAVYGERDTEVFIFFQTFNRGLMTMVGMKDKELSLIHVLDLVRGFYLAAINENSVCKTYFISSEKLYNWNEIGKITAKVLNKKALKVKVPHFIVYTIAAIAQFFAMFSSKPATLNLEKARDLVQVAWTCDTSKAIKELGYRQEISVEEGIKRTCDWYKEMKWF
ncbi:MAG: NAD(P)-dependent oxidoreductase [Ignavibacteria bacterium]|jgi:nucleoside-diphosphate-sugar epimerase|nr:NAD(P)-dependent oxidoreductase [Ignavibacteria bacterium]MCU7502272.1 NAD(P)-dependent oxidoreductase [Ignavibacteria bacterium]MCU7516684.1 NAD(P)-dependent oxidoreductase [Ignavibacteria bacterium]